MGSVEIEDTGRCVNDPFFDEDAANGPGRSERSVDRNVALLRRCAEAPRNLARLRIQTVNVAVTGTGL